MPYSGVADPDIPDNVSESDKSQWVSAFNSAYDACQSGDVEPEGDGDCESYAFAVAYAAIKRGKKKMTNFITKFFDDLRNLIDTHQQRAMSVSQIAYQVEDSLYPMWINDIYRDSDGALYATVIDGGKLYRANISFDSEGIAEAGELQEVEVQHTPVTRAYSVKRQADGTYRWFEVSCTSVLNKDGEIDSTALFDSFVSYIERTGKYPYRTFMHQGEAFRMGQYDFIARDGFVLIGSGVYDDNELAKMDRKARKKNPDFWGQSVHYAPVGDPELWEVADGINIPVYRAGILEEISSLPVEFASAHYTNKSDIKQEVNRSMLKGRELKAFTAYFDGDEEAAKAWLEENVDRTNSEITSSRQIARASEDEEETPEIEDEVELEEEVEEEVEDEVEEEEVVVAEQEDDEEEEELEDIVIDDEVISTVADTVLASQAMADFQTSVTAQLEQISSQLSEMQSASMARAKKIQKRFEALEEDEEEKLRQLRNDSPRNESRPRVTYRPRAVQEEDDEDPTFEEIANQTIAGIK